MNTCYDSAMSEDDKLINFIANTVESLRQRVDTISEQMATKVDLANLRDEMVTEFAAVKEQMVTKDELAAVKAQMATKDELKDGLAALRIEMATKNDLGRLETTMRGEFEQVHLRLDSIDRRVDTRIGQVETDVSRLRSVVYLLVKDKPDMLRLLGQPNPGESRPQN
ncbi:MAG TPA: hypothetical protein VKC61_17895 [Pyrinomonadaceae bacterium]|nr:hypothetical protein [Pyrinomonadaceae bacterium]